MNNSHAQCCVFLKALSLLFFLFANDLSILIISVTPAILTNWLADLSPMHDVVITAAAGVSASAFLLLSNLYQDDLNQEWQTSKARTSFGMVQAVTLMPWKQEREWVCVQLMRCVLISEFQLVMKSRYFYLDPISRSNVAYLI